MTHARPRQPTARARRADGGTAAGTAAAPRRSSPRCWPTWASRSRSSSPSWSPAPPRCWPRRSTRVADSGNQVLLLVGGRRAKRAATPEHPFGYGRDRYIYGFIVVDRAVQRRWPVRRLRGRAQAPAPRGAGVAAGRSACSLVAIVLEGFSLRTAIKETDEVKPPGESYWRVHPARPGAGAAGRPARGHRRAASACVLRAARRRRWPRSPATASTTAWAPSPSACCWSSSRSILGGGDQEPAAGRVRDPGGPAARSSPRWRTATGVVSVIHMRTQHLGPDELLVAAKIAVAARRHGGRGRPGHRRRRGAGPRRRADRPGDLPRARHPPPVHRAGGRPGGDRPGRVRCPPATSGGRRPWAGVDASPVTSSAMWQLTNAVRHYPWGSAHGDPRAPGGAVPGRPPARRAVDGRAPRRSRACCPTGARWTRRSRPSPTPCSGRRCASGSGRGCPS